MLSYPRRTFARVLRISRQCPIFVETKTRKAMTSLDSPFDRLVRLMAADPALPDFPSACRRLRVTPGIFSEMLLRQTGFCGEEIFFQIRVELLAE